MTDEMIAEIIVEMIIAPEKEILEITETLETTENTENSDTKNVDPWIDTIDTKGILVIIGQ
jgi:hypothetical protein